MICACRDCFEIAVLSVVGGGEREDLCGACADSDCDGEGTSNCNREDAYARKADARPSVLCQCGWGVLAIEEEDIPERCPVCNWNLTGATP